jgi:hypothetical protein
MGLFGLFGKKEKPSESENKTSEGKSDKNNVLLAMPMFVNNETFDLVKIKSHLKNHWGLDVSSTDGDGSTAVLTINGEMMP